MADADRHRFVAGLEAAVVDAYRVAIERATLDPALASTLDVLAQHHDEHATALAALAALPRADITPNAALYAELNQTLLGDDPLTAVIAVEDALAATHLASLGDLESSDGAAAVAAILPVEAQHAVAAGIAGGLDAGSAALVPAVQHVERAYTPASHPA